MTAHRRSKSKGTGQYKTKNISVPTGLEEFIRREAARNDRSFSSQAVYMLKEAASRMCTDDKSLTPPAAA